MRTVLVIPNLKYDKNLLHSIRTAEAFGVTEICLMSNRNLDKIFPKGSMKAYRHMTIKRFDNYDDLITYLVGERLKIVCIENTDNAIPLNKYIFPSNVALIMGHENMGVSDILLHKYNSVIIPQYGLVGCLNTCVAMSIVMYERFKQRLKV